MDKPVLKDSLRLFEALGTIKSRSMFGGFGVFADEVMFALVVGETLYIRADSVKAQYYREQGLEPYVYKKRGFPVVTKYFAVPQEQWQNPSDIFAEATHALSIARQEKQQQAQAKPTRLKDLPNLRLASERMLKKAGINSVEELHRQGAAKAYLAIRASQSTAPGHELLWALEGAIKGSHWSVVPQARRDELLQQIN
ncbi:TfoX/Sxy family DNA transformation protein [Vibrio sp. SCSIO 43136]|uniref:TfoX/Sxy family DNA transformation protein n=1 Tax=Vibrio sp. SCSIO 43136 TaxID=2819101 RepID=UPI0020764151|nr:TfoX/Sxy family DNA transformation protein [Vibrio sp. SCSIO 43136]USD66264.1 TfoX/Sxy family DNA transformation protein [Vibrio sp. SCSIO 43136]